MLEKFITTLRSWKNHLLNKSRYDDSPVSFGDEYALLIKNKRIYDYSNGNTKYGLALRIGFYMDTYNYLTGNADAEIAKNNLNKVLGQVAPGYKELIKEKFSHMTDKNHPGHGYSPKHERVYRLFKVQELDLADGKSESQFCINLFIRPDSDPFLIIGKPPKGKLKDQMDITIKTNESKGIGKGRKEDILDWDNVDFQ